MSKFEFTEKERDEIDNLFVSFSDGNMMFDQLLDCIESIINEREEWVRVEDVNKMLRQGIAYGMGVICGKHNLHQSEEFIRSTCKNYADELLKQPPKSEQK